MIDVIYPYADITAMWQVCGFTKNKQEEVEVLID